VPWKLVRNTPCGEPSNWLSVITVLWFFLRKRRATSNAIPATATATAIAPELSSSSPLAKPTTRPPSSSVPLLEGARLMLGIMLVLGAFETDGANDRDGAALTVGPWEGSGEIVGLAEVLGAALTVGD
jgi:hypothetical protein